MCFNARWSFGGKSIRSSAGGKEQGMKTWEGKGCFRSSFHRLKVASSAQRKQEGTSWRQETNRMAIKTGKANNKLSKNAQTCSQNKTETKARKKAVISQGAFQREFQLLEEEMNKMVKWRRDRALEDICLRLKKKKKGISWFPRANCSEENKSIKTADKDLTGRRKLDQAKTNVQEGGWHLTDWPSLTTSIFFTHSSLPHPIPSSTLPLFTRYEITTEGKTCGRFLCGCLNMASLGCIY